MNATALLGRTFTRAEVESETRVVVLAHPFWVNRFGADADLVGSTIELGGEAHEVVGVLPEEFEFLDPRSSRANYRERDERTVFPVDSLSRWPRSASTV